MCMQFDFLFTCGHRGFAKFANCPRFGTTCYGAGGIHTDWPVNDICLDCKNRFRDPNPNGRAEEERRRRKQQ
jgi:hypothetical protein